MFQRMDVEKLVKEIEAHAAARRAMDGQRHVELFSGLVDRIEIAVAVAFVQDPHHEHEPSRQAYSIGASDLTLSFDRLIHRQEGNRFKPRVKCGESLGYP